MRPMKETKKEHRIAYITVYAIGRSYGGPEEGGWWYDTYEPVASVPFMATVKFRAREVTGEPDDVYRHAHKHDILQSLCFSNNNGKDEFIWEQENITWDRPDAVAAEIDRLQFLYDTRRSYQIREEFLSGIMSMITRPMFC